MPFFNIIKRDLKLAFKKGEILNIAAFFVLCVSLFPFGIGIDGQVLANIAPGVIWACVLLSSSLGLARIFEHDYQNGILSGIYLQGVLPEVIVIAKAFSHWITSILPVIIISPFMALFLNLPLDKIYLMLISLLVGTLVLSVVGVFTACLLIGTGRGGNVTAILSLPFYVPVIIFGSSAISNNSLGQLSVLFAFLMIIFPVSVFASGFVFKIVIGDE